MILLKGWGISLKSSEHNVKRLAISLKRTENLGMKEIRLCWVEGNPQAEHFWHKNGFKETGATKVTEVYTAIVARKELI